MNSTPIPLPELLEALRGMRAAAEPGDFVYTVREREGEGWEGPKVTAWGNGAAAIARAVTHGISGEGPVPNGAISELIRRAIFTTAGGYFAVPETPEAREVFARLMRAVPPETLESVDFAVARRARIGAFDRALELHRASMTGDLSTEEAAELAMCRALLTGDVVSPGEHRLESELRNAMQTAWLILRAAGGAVTIERGLVERFDPAGSTLSVEDHHTGARTYRAHAPGDVPDRERRLAVLCPHPRAADPFRNARNSAPIIVTEVSDAHRLRGLVFDFVVVGDVPPLLIALAISCHGRRLSPETMLPM